jgi:hypothetical protein
MIVLSFCGEKLSQKEPNHSPGGLQGFAGDNLCSTLGSRFFLLAADDYMVMCYKFLISVKGGRCCRLE